MNIKQKKISDDSEVSCIVKTKPYKSPDGGIIGIIENFTDITAQKKAEEEIFKERARLELILKYERLLANIASKLSSNNFSKCGIAKIFGMIKKSVGIDGITIYCFSSEYIKMFDSENNNMNSNLSGIQKIDNWQLSKVDWMINYIKKGKRFVSFDISEFSEQEKDLFKKQKIKAVSIFPIRMDKQVRGAICFSKNHTYIWKKEELDFCQTVSEIIASICERQYRYYERTKAEEKQIEAVQVANRALHLATAGGLTYGIAHEINQPLNALRMAVDFLLFNRDQYYSLQKDELKQKLNFISQQVEDINNIIKQMRILAEGEKFIETQQIDINEIILKALSIINNQIQLNNVKINLKLNESLPNINGHSMQMEQIVVNLVTNAIDALRESPRKVKKIWIITRYDNSNCVLKICDNGSGISEEYLKQIFDPFFTSKHQSENMGLGLFITKNIVITGFNGKISVKSKKEKGTCFTISIPVLEK